MTIAALEDSCPGPHITMVTASAPLIGMASSSRQMVRNLATRSMRKVYNRVQIGLLTALCAHRVTVMRLNFAGFSTSDRYVFLG